MRFFSETYNTINNTKKIHKKCTDNNTDNMKDSYFTRKKSKNNGQGMSKNIIYHPEMSMFYYRYVFL